MRWPWQQRALNPGRPGSAYRACNAAAKLTKAELADILNAGRFPELVPVLMAWALDAGRDCATPYLDQTRADIIHGYEHAKTKHRPF